MIEAYPSVPDEPFGYISGSVVFPGGVASVSDRTPVVAASLTAWPFKFDKPTPIDYARIWLVTHQTGAEARAGLYSNVDAHPSALLADLGAQALTATSDRAVTFDANLTVKGWVWLLIWIKNVATQATIRGPGSNFATQQQFPALDVFLQYPTFRPYLYIESAYPGSMPATAPAMIPAFEEKVPLPILGLT
jgi:hypothetical protein